MFERLSESSDSSFWASMRKQRGGRAGGQGRTTVRESLAEARVVHADRALCVRVARHYIRLLIYTHDHSLSYRHARHVNRSGGVRGMLHCSGTLWRFRAAQGY